MFDLFQITVLRTLVRRLVPSRRHGALLLWAIVAGVFTLLPAVGTVHAQDTWTTPHPGIRMLDRRAAGPRRIHALVVDLCRAGVSIRATRRSERGQTPSSFGSSVNAEAAINGDFFSYATYDPSGAAIGNGEAWSHADSSRNGFLAFGREQVDLSPPAEVHDPLPAWAQQLVSGHPQILRGGSVVSQTSDLCTARHPRSAAGLSRDRQTLYLMVVDGRTSSSIGMTCAEEARFLRELGAWDAMNQDGGGSSAMWVRGRGIVNHPSDGVTRVVGNHLAIQADGGNGLAASCRPWEPYEAAGMAQAFESSTTTDIDGDGRADLCARAAAGIRCRLAAGGAFDFDPTEIIGPGLSDDHGWQDPSNHRTIAFGDVTGDGRADLCARANAGMRCWPSTGDGFSSPAIEGPELSDDRGWDALDRYATIRLADVSGDGIADLCARGAAGFRCFTSTGDGFGPSWSPIAALSDDEGFSEDAHWSTIRMGDIDHDGRMDVCARSVDGVLCFRSLGDAFEETPVMGPGWSDMHGWAKPEHSLTFRVVDVDGDGRADVCARAAAGFRCHLSTGDGFGPAIALDAMKNEGGWNAIEYYTTIRLADIDGDGDRDVCARAARGILCWPFEEGGWGARIEGPTLADDVGWARAAHYRTIRFADLDGDGDEDLCARAAVGMLCWSSGPDGFGARIAGPEWSNDAGWARPRFHETLRFASPPPVVESEPPPPPSGDDASVPPPPPGDDAGVGMGTADGGVAPPIDGDEPITGGCSAAASPTTEPAFLLILLALTGARRRRRRRR